MNQRRLAATIAMMTSIHSSSVTNDRMPNPGYGKIRSPMVRSPDGDLRHHPWRQRQCAKSEDHENPDDGERRQLDAIVAS